MDVVQEERSKYSWRAPLLLTDLFCTSVPQAALALPPTSKEVGMLGFYVLVWKYQPPIWISVETLNTQSWRFQMEHKTVVWTHHRVRTRDNIPTTLQHNSAFWYIQGYLFLFKSYFLIRTNFGSNPIILAINNLEQVYMHLHTNPTDTRSSSAINTVIY